MFFASRPQQRNSHYSLSIQFANLYHDSKNSTNDEIKLLSEWGQSLEKMGVKTSFKPLCVTEDPEFSPTPLQITNDKFEERQKKDRMVALNVQWIREQMLSHDLETKISLQTRVSSESNSDGTCNL